MFTQTLSGSLKQHGMTEFPEYVDASHTLSSKMCCTWYLTAAAHCLHTAGGTDTGQMRGKPKDPASSIHMCCWAQRHCTVGAGQHSYWLPAADLDPRILEPQLMCSDWYKLSAQKICLSSTLHSIGLQKQCHISSLTKCLILQWL